jgi:hypothetical protein
MLTTVFYVVDWGNFTFLGAFPELRIATISLAVRNSSALTGRIFMKVGTWVFRKFNRHNESFTWTRMLHLWKYLAGFFLDSEVFQTKLVGKIKHIICSVTFPKIVPFLDNVG